MSVELILLDNVENLGKIGDTVKVADGYARNYLVPKKLAAKATPGVLRQLETRKKKYIEKYEKDIQSAQLMSERISSNSISIPVQASDDDKLFGSVTAQRISEALAEIDLNIEKRQIVLAEPIRQLGVYNIDIHLHPEVTASLKVWVVKA